MVGIWHFRVGDIMAAPYFSFMGIFLGNQKMTLEQVGNKFGVSKERIRKAQLNALRKLRQKIEEDKVKQKEKGKTKNISAP